MTGTRREGRVMRTWLTRPSPRPVASWWRSRPAVFRRCSPHDLAFERSPHRPLASRRTAVCRLARRAQRRGVVVCAGTPRLARPCVTAQAFRRSPAPVLPNRQASVTHACAAPASLPRSKRWESQGKTPCGGARSSGGCARVTRVARVVQLRGDIGVGKWRETTR